MSNLTTLEQIEASKLREVLTPNAKIMNKFKDSLSVEEKQNFVNAGMNQIDIAMFLVRSFHFQGGLTPELAFDRMFGEGSYEGFKMLMLEKLSK